MLEYRTLIQRHSIIIINPCSWQLYISICVRINCVMTLHTKWCTCGWHSIIRPNNFTTISVFAFHFSLYPHKIWICFRIQRICFRCNMSFVHLYICIIFIYTNLILIFLVDYKLVTLKPSSMLPIFHSKML